MMKLASVLAIAGIALAGTVSAASAGEDWSSWTRPSESQILDQGVATNPNSTYRTTYPGCGCAHYTAHAAMRTPDTSLDAVRDGRDTIFVDRDHMTTATNDSTSPKS